MSFASSYLSGNVLIFLVYCWRVFAEYRILGFFFQHFKDAIPLSSGSYEKLLIYLIEDVLFAISHFFFCCYQDFLIVCDFVNLIMMCLGMNLFESTWSSWSFSDV
jgi:hypothetical protein